MRLMTLLSSLALYSSTLFAEPAKTIEIPINIPIDDVVQHQGDYFFASHSGLLKLSNGRLFKMRDSGIDLGRLRQLEVGVEPNKIFAGGYGLWEVNLLDYKSKQLFPEWVNRFVVTDSHYYVDDSQKLIAIARTGNHENTTIFESSVNSLAQVENQVFALTDGGLYTIINTAARLIKTGQYKHLLANQVYLVMQDTEYLYVFSRGNGEWKQFKLPGKVTKAELGVVDSELWLRVSGIWTKFNLQDFQVMETIARPAGLLFEGSDGPMLFDGTSISQNKKTSFFDVQTKPLVSSGTFEPYIFKFEDKVFASGVGGIYEISTGDLIKPFTEHITNFYTSDGSNFVIGTTKGIYLADGSKVGNGYVADITQNQDSVFAIIDNALYRVSGNYAKEIGSQLISNEELLNLRQVGSELFALTDKTIYRVKQTLEPLAELDRAIWEDVYELNGTLYALSYNHGIFKIEAGNKPASIKSNQTLPTRFFNHNGQLYVFGREGICRITSQNCQQISAGVSGKHINSTKNGIYYTNPHGVWMLDERTLLAKPTLQYVMKEQRPVLDKNITVAFGEPLVLHYDMIDGTAVIAGEEYPIFNHIVAITPAEDFDIDGGWNITVIHNFNWLILLMIPVVMASIAGLVALHRAKTASNAEFVRLSRYQLHADEIRRACDMTVEIADKLNSNTELGLSRATYLSSELQDLLAPLAMNARLRESDNLRVALQSHVTSIFSIHPDLKVRVGDCEPIPGKLNADAYHLILHMVRYAIGRLGAKNINIHVLRETENCALLCVEHDGQYETIFHRWVKRSSDFLVMQSIAHDYGQQVKFFKGEMNLQLQYEPKHRSTPQQAYFTATASRFGSKFNS